MKITIMIAGVAVELSPMYDNYLPLYRRFETAEEPRCSVNITKEELLEAREVYPPESTPQYLEHMQLCYKLSTTLLPFGRVFFHGVAVGYRGRAYIITAPSGVGKTTMYLALKIKMGDELTLINGDKPVLEFAEGGVVVHHSPWNGKEHMGRPVCMPLGGIVFLDRGDPHAVRVMPREVAAEAFCQFLFNADNAADTRAVAALCERLISGVPLWRFYSRADDATADSFYNEILRREPDDRI